MLFLNFLQRKRPMENLKTAQFDGYELKDAMESVIIHISKTAADFGVRVTLLFFLLLLSLLLFFLFFFIFSYIPLRRRPL